MTTTKLLPPPPTQTPPRGSPVPLILLGVAWFATPVLFFCAMVVGAPWFGETPSAAEVAQSQALLAGAGVTGVVGPAIGTALALAWGRRVAASLLGAALTVTLAAAVWLQLS
jgi:hypothetical protein